MRQVTQRKAYLLNPAARGTVPTKITTILENIF